MAKAKVGVSEWQQAQLDAIKPEDTVYTLTLSVNSMGTSRQIKVFVVQDGRIVDISAAVARKLGYRLNDKNLAIVRSGGGTNFEYDIVNHLSGALFNNGDLLTKRSL